ncbi:MAG: hypothetical protein L7S55_09195 [Luminiphilus sp.]|nr:hypothetical protein [Luminiphilus sp.]
MPLNQKDAEQLVHKCKMLWNNPFKVTSSTAFEWAQAAGELNHGEIDRALDSFAEQGDKFPPSVAELMARAKSFRTSKKGSIDAPVCSYCGGPFWAGAPGLEQVKSHYGWCHLADVGERGKFVQHRVHVGTVDDDPHCPPQQPANVRPVPISPELRAKLKLITDVKRS